MNHEKRRFTRKVRFITSPGFGAGGRWREKNHLSGGGPSKIISSLGTFSFDQDSREMMLSSCHPGVTIAQIKRETGWRLKIAADAGETPPPTEAELTAVRKYDPRKLWTA
jgi:glutaconate CoA-transferase subunit B